MCLNVVRHPPPACTFSTLDISQQKQAFMWCLNVGCQKHSRHKGYEFVINGAYRDAYDENGRLILNTGEEVDTHNWTAEDWKGLGENSIRRSSRSGATCIQLTIFEIQLNSQTPAWNIWMPQTPLGTPS